ncbi:unannotated protein [freshwater metagenome]|uniref:Unannotated protein n=1 Tax=freshwater metagenome TaxID=449393 RepID=A0A6J7JAV8_9ZZZZ
MLILHDRGELHATRLGHVAHALRRVGRVHVAQLGRSARDGRHREELRQTGPGHDARVARSSKTATTPKRDAHQMPGRGLARDRLDREIDHERLGRAAIEQLACPQLTGSLFEAAKVDVAAAQPRAFGRQLAHAGGVHEDASALHDRDEADDPGGEHDRAREEHHVVDLADRCAVG